MADEKNTNEVPPAETEKKSQSQQLNDEELNISGGAVSQDLICGKCGVNPCTCNV